MADTKVTVAVVCGKRKAGIAPSEPSPVLKRLKPTVAEPLTTTTLRTEPPLVDTKSTDLKSGTPPASTLSLSVSSSSSSSCSSLSSSSIDVKAEKTETKRDVCKELGLAPFQIRRLMESKINAVAVRAAMPTRQSSAENPLRAHLRTVIERAVDGAQCREEMFQAFRIDQYGKLAAQQNDAFYSGPKLTLTAIEDAIKAERKEVDAVWEEVDDLKKLVPKKKFYDVQLPVDSIKNWIYGRAPLLDLDNATILKLTGIDMEVIDLLPSGDDAKAAAVRAKSIASYEADLVRARGSCAVARVRTTEILKWLAHTCASYLRIFTSGFVPPGDIKAHQARKYQTALLLQFHKSLKLRIAAISKILDSGMSVVAELKFGAALARMDEDELKNAEFDEEDALDDLSKPFVGLRAAHFVHGEEKKKLMDGLEDEKDKSVIHAWMGCRAGMTPVFGGQMEIILLIEQYTYSRDSLIYSPRVKERLDAIARCQARAHAIGLSVDWQSARAPYVVGRGSVLPHGFVFDAMLDDPRVGVWCKLKLATFCDAVQRLYTKRQELIQQHESLELHLSTRRDFKSPGVLRVVPPMVARNALAIETLSGKLVAVADHKEAVAAHPAKGRRMFQRCRTPVVSKSVVRRLPKYDGPEVRATLSGLYPDYELFESLLYIGGMFYGKARCLRHSMPDSTDYANLSITRHVPIGTTNLTAVIRREEDNLLRAHDEQNEELLANASMKADVKHNVSDDAAEDDDDMKKNNNEQTDDDDDEEWEPEEDDSGDRDEDS